MCGVLVYGACVCVCVCVCMCTYRVGQNVPERSHVADTIPVDSRQPALQDDNDYSTVDDVQQQMLVISGNPAYKFVPKHSHQPLEEDDQAYSNIDVCQQEEGTAFGAAAGAK